MRVNVFFLFALACKSPVTGPLSVPPSEPPVEIEDLSEVLETLRAEARVPALAAAEIDGSGLIALGATGTRQRGGDDPVAVDDPFHLGSDTKAMTAAWAAVQVEAGTLDWTTRVPDVWPNAHAGWSDATLLDLVTHRSGASSSLGAQHPSLWNEIFVRDADDPAATRAWFAETLLASPPDHPPGDYIYSNAGFMLAGAMVEALDGRAWEDSLTEDLFTPLGMTRCGFGAPRGHAPWGHTGAMPVDPLSFPSDNPRALGPAGTVHCPLADWALFVHAHLVRSSFLTEASWDVLQSPVGTYAPGWLAVEQPWTNGPALAHDGSNTFWLASAWIVPGRDRAWLIATNRGDSNATAAVSGTLDMFIAR